MTHEPWICEVCQKPIIEPARPATAVRLFGASQPEGGVISILDRARAEQRSAEDNVGELEVIGDDEIEDASAMAARQIDEARRLLRAPSAEFHVYHLERCSPPAQMGDYVITCSRARTMDSWIAWMLHVGEKNWMMKGDVLRMAAFWYSGHGHAVPTDLS